jgi:hypothetical protein
MHSVPWPLRRSCKSLGFDDSGFRVS